MDFIGFSIYNKLLLGDKPSLDDLRIDGEEPDDVFTQVLDRVDELVDSVAATGPQAGGVLHLCDVGLIEQDFVRAPWIEAASAPRRHPFLLGFHINFSHENLPLAPGFLRTFKVAMNTCGDLGVDAMVMHAPLVTTADTDASFIAELTSEGVIEAMKRNNTILCWENAQDPKATYKHLDRLLSWREQLVLELERTGNGDLANRHRFCLDTGHLLLTIQRDGVPASHADDFLASFAKHVKVFHIHANDGSADQHLLPFLDVRAMPPGPKNVDPARLEVNSRLVMAWLRTCEEHAGVEQRHVHLEAASPAPLAGMVAFYRRYYDETG